MHFARKHANCSTWHEICTKFVLIPNLFGLWYTWYIDKCIRKLRITRSQVCWSTSQPVNLPDFRLPRAGVAVDDLAHTAVVIRCDVGVVVDVFVRVFGAVVVGGPVSLWVSGGRKAKMSSATQSRSVASPTGWPKTAFCWPWNKSCALVQGDHGLVDHVLEVPNCCLTAVPLLLNLQLHTQNLANSVTT